MGLRVGGIKIRDQNGELTINKHGSEAYRLIRNEKLMKDYIEQVFRSN